MRSFVRMIFSSVTDAASALKKAAGSARAEESLENRSFVQHYGFSSSPKAGAVGIALASGQDVVIIADDDTSCRVAVESGEVCLYTDEGDMIHFKRGKEIVVVAGTKVNVTAPDVFITGNLTVSGVITTPNLVVTNGMSASESQISISAPHVSVSGTLAVTGSISSAGSITDSGGNTNHHSHS